MDDTEQADRLCFELLIDERAEVIGDCELGRRSQSGQSEEARLTRVATATPEARLTSFRFNIEILQIDCDTTFEWARGGSRRSVTGE